jgi:hypothetical protein
LKLAIDDKRDSDLDERIDEKITRLPKAGHRREIP